MTTTLFILVLLGVLLFVGLSAWKQSDARREEDGASKARSELARDWNELLNRSDVVILDTETTGLGKRSELVELALVDTQGSIRLDQPIMPLGRITKETSDIHGLTRARLKELGARPWPEVQRDWNRVMRGTQTLLVWNAAFDLRLLQQTVAKHEERGLRPSGSADPPSRVNGRCLMQEYASLYGRPQMGLDAAAALEGVSPVEPRHRARGDSLTTLALMRAVVERADQLPEGWQATRRRPGWASAPAWRDEPATEKQIGYALSLLERTGREGEYEFEDLEAMSKGELSELIDELKEDVRS